MAERSPSPRYERRRSERPDRRDKSDTRDRDYVRRDRGSDYARRRDYDRREPEAGRDERRGSERRDRDRERRGEHDRRDRGSDYPRDSRQSDYGRRRSRSPPRRSSRSRSKSGEPEVDRTKPNFGASGLLAAETKTVKGADGTKTVLKYHEPPEARKPPVGWRLYVFKGSEQVDLLHLQKQSAYLVGRDRAVVDIFVEHPSCSKQHAVFQFRHVREKNEFGEVSATVKPFVIDLESTNGTKVNDNEIPAARYYELKVNDIIKFGDSLREYVLLHEEAS